MALVAGGGGGLASFQGPVPVAMVPFGGPSPYGNPDFGNQFHHDLDAIAADAAGGAWDVRAWTRPDGHKSGAQDVLCVELGSGNIRAAHWDPADKKPLHLRVGLAGSDAAENVVSFVADVTGKRLKRWFGSAGQEQRLRGELPKGVACTASLPGALVTVRSPTRLLGLTPDDAFLVQEGSKLGVNLIARNSSSVEDATVVACLRLGDSEDIDLEVEELVALLLAHLKYLSQAPDEDGDSSFSARGIAVAVPGWWLDSERAAVAGAAARAGLPLRRLCSRALCVAAASPEGVDEVFQRRWTSLESGADEGVELNMLLLDLSEESVEAALLEGIELCEAGGRIWHTKAAAGCRASGNPQADVAALVAAAERVLSDGTSSPRVGHGSVAIVMLSGSADLEAEGSALRTLLERILGADSEHPASPIGRDSLAKALVLRVPPSAAVEGLVRIVAAEDAAEGAFGVAVVDALPATIGVRERPTSWSAATASRKGYGDDDVDVLFKRGTALPAKATRTYIRRDTDLNLTLVQQSSMASACSTWRACLSLLEVLTGIDGDGEPAPCEKVVVKFSVDAWGLLTAAVEETHGMPPPRSKRRGKSRLKVLLIFLLLVGAFIGWYSRHVAARRADYRFRLAKFLTQHNPTKLPEIDNWLDKYAGTEDVLVQRLEAKYRARFPPSTGESEPPLRDQDELEL